MAEKVTTMNLMVDLQCDKCRKTVTKVLRKFPREIRDPIYDEKQNIVTITVVSCNPEKIMEKLCRKGCGCIKSIEIVDTMNKKELDKKREPQKPPPEEPLESEPESPKENPSEPKPEPPQQTPLPPAPTVPAPAIPPAALVPIGICCVPCYEGRPGGPCFEGYGGPPPCYCGCYCGRPVYDSYGGGTPCYVSRCDQYFSDENPLGCTIM